MLSRSFFLSCKKFIPCRGCIKISPRELSSQQPLYRSFREQYSSRPSDSSENFFQKYKFVLAGIAVVSGASAYILLTRKSQKDKDLAGETAGEPPPKFVDEHLEENLKLLEEFGPVPYLLIGAGTASFAAFRSIRGRDPTSKIVVLGEEPYYPYMRPPLSKEMWFEPKSGLAEKLIFKQWNGKERSVFFEKNDFYAPVKDMIENKNGGVSIIRGVKVVRIDPTEQIVYLDNGRSLSYEKCLLATGGVPKNLPIFENTDMEIKKHVTRFRNVDDFKKLDKISRTVKSITIVGGGFLGSELACALGLRGKEFGLKVTQVFPEAGNMGKVLPEYLSNWSTEKVRKQGVTVLPKSNISGVSLDGKKVKLCLDKGECVSTDHVVVAVGLDPRTELAEVSGLEVDPIHGGFLVNAELEARKNLWIAGDAACFYDIKLGRRRVEHHDHAVVSGRLAGENMAGKGKPYWHQSMFWSDLGPEIGYEAIGIVDSSLETVGVFSKATSADTPKAVVEATGESIRSETEVQDKPSTEIKFDSTLPRVPLPGDDYGKGIVFYLRNNTIVGIILWNVFTKMPIARKIINEAKPYEDLAEVAKLFDLKSSSESNDD